MSDPSTGGTWTATNTRATVSGGLVTGVTVGVDTIVYTVINGCGTASANKVVTVNPLPYAGTITGATSVCSGATITLTDATPGGTWSSSSTTTATVSSGGVVTGGVAGTAIIWYSVTTACGTATANQAIVVNPLPNAGTIAGGSSVCVGLSITLTDPTPGGFWGETNSHATVIGGIVYGMTAGVDTITYTITNLCGTSTASKTVAVNPLPYVGIISGSSSVCTGSSITLTDPVTGGTWSAFNGNATVGSTGVVTGVTAGVDTIQYTIVNSCATTASYRTITINPMPTAGTITGLSAVCTGSNITLTDTMAGGTWTATNGNATVSSGGVVYGITAGSDTVIYTVTNSCNTATATKAITINPMPDAGSISGLSLVCIGTADTLTDTAPGGIWSATNVKASVTAGVVTGVTAGVDTIIYTVTNSCSTATTDKIVSISPMPYAGVITGKDTVCMGGNILFTDTTSGGVWNTVTGVASVTTTGIVLGVNYGYDTVRYKVSNSCGTAVASYPVFVNQPGECNVGVEITPTGTMLTVIPNPNKGMFTVKGTQGSLSDEQVTIEVTDLLGQVIYKNQTLKQNGLLDQQVQLNNVANGMYILSVRSGSENKVFHIVVEQ